MPEEPLTQSPIIALSTHSNQTFATLNSEILHLKVLFPDIKTVTFAAVTNQEAT